MAIHKVGGEVDAFCTKCKMTLAHTILAMLGTKIARVRCNTCGGDHAYRSEPGARARAPSAPRAARARVVIGFEQQLEGKDLSKAKPYSPKDSYAVDELISHPTFGLGLVTGLRGDKVDVAFKAAQKTLVHGRGEGAERPVFHPPSSAVNAPADKLPVGGETPAPVPHPLAVALDEGAQDEDPASV
ncbi:MAG: hypothetical protein ACYC8T_25685 [Myxococcaceae bacterium]